MEIDKVRFDEEHMPTSEGWSPSTRISPVTDYLRNTQPTQAELDRCVVLTTVDKVLNYGRSWSFWPVTFGLACCAIEMMCSGGRVSTWRVLATKFSVHRHVTRT